VSAAVKTRGAPKVHTFAAPASVPAIAASALALQAGADAELVRLCAAYTAALDVIDNSKSVLEPDDNPAWRAAQAMEDRLLEIPATTFEGLMAKARVAQHQARQPDGSENYSDSYTGCWPEQIVRDLLRLKDQPTEAPCDDGSLLSAFATYQALKAEERALEDEAEPAFGTQQAKAREARFETLVEKQDAAVETLIASQARTAAGLQAKAQMVAQTLPNAVVSFELNLESDAIRLALSLAADLGGSPE
jgi:hypothetical protein